MFYIQHPEYLVLLSRMNRENYIYSTFPGEEVCFQFFIFFISVSMVCLFASFYFQTVCVFIFDMLSLLEVYSRILHIFLV